LVRLSIHRSVREGVVWCYPRLRYLRFAPES
jgi:hypothetical protein